RCIAVCSTISACLPPSIPTLLSIPPNLYRFPRKESCKNGKTLPTSVAGSPLFDDEEAYCGATAMVTDITERRQADAEQLRLSNHFRLLLESTSEGIFGADVDGVCSFINPPGAALLGYEPDELVGKSLHNLIHNRHPDGTPYPREECAHLRAMWSDTDAPAEEEVFWRRDGTSLQVECRTRLVKDAGMVRGSVVSFLDISQRKKHEEAMLESREFLQSTLDSLSANIGIFDAEGTILASNAGWRRFAEVNVTPERHFAVGTNYLTTCDAIGRKNSEAAAVAATVRDVIAGRRLHAELEYPLYGSSEVGWYRIQITRFERQGDVRVVFAAENISERKAIEQALSDSESMLRAVVETSPDSIAILERRSGLIKFASPVTQNLIGYAPADLIGKTLAGIVHPDDWESGARFLSEALLDDVSEPLRLRFLNSEGQVVWLEARTRRMPKLTADQTGAIVVVAREVTAQVQMEAELRQATEAAEQANREKSDFLSRMSHELRTPLNAILGFAQLLEMDDLEKEQCEELEQILSAGRHLLDLIKEVLDLARIESGRLSLTLEAVSLETIVEECLPLVSSLAAGRKVQLNLDVSCVDLRPVLADHQRLKQVLLNLFTNAVKYNRDGGTVTLTCDEVEGEHMRIEVRDTGYGISDEKLARLYSPFDRLGAEQTKVEGYGLGLSLSKNLVQAMNGRIGVDSVVGEGSCFWVELPLTETPQTETESEAVEPGPTKTNPSITARTVLYIEDNLSNLEVVEHTMSRRPGLTLLTALEGGLGLELARQHRPHLILLDMHLPDTTGDVVLERLKEDPITRDIPVVMVSADATTRQIERLLAGGAREYLTKPLNLKRFMTVVETVLAETDND
ncbi:MAG: PAS domain S-box protein, partial [Dehalococcoidia bacterium]